MQSATYASKKNKMTSSELTVKQTAILYLG